MSLDNGKLLHLYRTMFTARRFEDHLSELFKSGRVAGWIHSCQGHEATGAVLGLCLREGDYLVPYHRSRASMLAKGLEPRRLMAEILGRVTGPCSGKGGEAHVAEPGLGILGAGGIIGSNIPIAVGIAYASRLQGRGRLVACGFGEGASNRGSFHEALNMASLWKLPVIFICENNLYAEFTHWSGQAAVAHVSDRAGAYGMPGVLVDGNDVFDLYRAISTAADRALRGDGPTLIEAMTYRWSGHYEGDPGSYRPAAEIEEWKARDPVLRLRQAVLDRGAATAEDLEAIQSEVEEVVREAVNFALSSPTPTAADVLAGAYA